MHHLVDFNIKNGMPRVPCLVFFFYVNDIDDGLAYKLSKFADDTKIGSKVTATQDREILEQTLIKWLDGPANGKWNLMFMNAKYLTLEFAMTTSSIPWMANIFLQ